MPFLVNPGLDTFYTARLIPIAMLQRKKLEFYAKQYGIEDFASIRLSDEECDRICKAVGVRTYKAAEVDRNIGTLISFVMDDPAFIEAHRKQGVNEEIFLIRCGDYAAKEVFKAYSGQ